MTAWRFLFFSLAAHLLFLVLLDQYIRLFPAQRPSEPVIVEFVNRTEKKVAQSIVRPSNDQNAVPRDRPRPRFLSERDQFAKKETSAPLQDRTQNTGPNSLGLKDLKPTLSESFSSTYQTQEKGDDGARIMAPPVMPRSLSGQDYVPDIAQGAVTALNAERFTYYTFFSRIEEKIYPLWARRARNVIQSMSREELFKLRDRSLTTKAEILLDETGKYLETRIFESSGVPALDATAVEAFKEAAQFYNPPREMVKSDGKIHLYWAFIVYVNPQ